MIGNSVGSVPLVQSQYPPQLITLSTSTQKRATSSLNVVNWDIPVGLKCPNQNYATLVTLDSFNFFNTFNNIESSANTIKILSTWTDSGIKKESMQTIVIPVGVYSITSLLQYLNTQCVLFSGGYIYGLGNPELNNGAIPAVLPFTLSDDSTTINVNAPSLTALAFTSTINHRYTGTYLVYDSTTKPLMQRLGICDIASSSYPSNTFLINTSITPNLYGIGYIYLFSNPNYTYSNSANGTVKSPDVFQLNLVNNILIRMNWATANTLDAINGMNFTNTVALVPVSGPSGYRITFYPPKPFPILINNLSTTTIQIQLFNADNSEPINFKGVDWTMSFKIEYFEIDNTPKSENNLLGTYHTSLPYLHNSVQSMYNTDSRNTAPGDYGNLIKRSRNK